MSKSKITSYSVCPDCHCLIKTPNLKMHREKVHKIKAETRKENREDSDLHSASLPLERTKLKTPKFKKSYSKPWAKTRECKATKKEGGHYFSWVRRMMTDEDAHKSKRVIGYSAQASDIIPEKPAFERIKDVPNTCLGPTFIRCPICKELIQAPIQKHLKKAHSDKSGKATETGD